MLFQELRELKKIVDKSNNHAHGEKTQFFNPHMYRDGRWAVAIIFGEVPELSDTWEVLDSCIYHALHAFWGVINGKVTLFIQ